jgi:hypothetical protein
VILNGENIILDLDFFPSKWIIIASREKKGAVVHMEENERFEWSCQ